MDATDDNGRRIQSRVRAEGTNELPAGQWARPRLRGVRRPERYSRWQAGPDRRSEIWRCDRGHNARFLSADQDPLATGNNAQDGGRPEVVVGPIGLRAIRSYLPPAREIVCVSRCRLSRPYQLTGLGVECED